MTLQAPAARLELSDAGEFTGYGAVYSVRDLVGEAVMPGAFVNLPDYRQRGVILWSHDPARPVAYPIDVRDDGVGLRVRGRFHGTPDAQQARQVAAERRLAGLLMGLSIGYVVLADRLERDGTRLLTKVALLEISLVSLPANPAAGVTDVKLTRREIAAAVSREESRWLVDMARSAGVTV